MSGVKLFVLVGWVSIVVGIMPNTSTAGISSMFSDSKLKKVAEDQIDTASDSDQGITSGVEKKHTLADNAVYHAGQGALVGSKLFDMYSTRKGIGAGAHETSPLNGNGSVGRMAAVKAPFAAAELFGMHELAKTHPKLAGILGAAISIPETIAGVHNMKLYNKLSAGKK